jgi:hypothetical protein
MVLRQSACCSIQVYNTSEHIGTNSSLLIKKEKNNNKMIIVRSGLIGMKTSSIFLQAN